MMFAAVLLHLAAALFHAWIRKDGVFSSMTKVRRRTGTIAPAKPA